MAIREPGFCIQNIRVFNIERLRSKRDFVEESLFVNLFSIQANEQWDDFLSYKNVRSFLLFLSWILCFTYKDIFRPSFAKGPGFQSFCSCLQRSLFCFKEQRGQGSFGTRKQEATNSALM